MPMTFRWMNLPAARLALPALLALSSLAGQAQAQTQTVRTAPQATLLPAPRVTGAMGDTARLKLVAGSPSGSGTADGPCPVARFSYPIGIVADAALNLYVADYYSHTIRRIAPDCTVSTLAGRAGVAGSSDGTGAAALFNGPTGLAIDASGTLYVTDTRNNLIRRITATGSVSTVAGRVGVVGSADGQGSAATFDFPQGIAVDAAGTLFVADTYNNTVRRISTAGVVDTLAGAAGITGDADGQGGAARFNEPTGIAVTPSGQVVLADSHNYTLRLISASGAVSTLAGTTHVAGTADGVGSRAQFGYPTGLSVDRTGNVYIVDSGSNTIRLMTPAAAVSTLAGTPGIRGSANGTGPAAAFNYPTGIVVAPNGKVYVADSRNFSIRAIGAGALVQTLAGDLSSSGSADGPGPQARLQSPSGVAVDFLGQQYIADTANNTIRKVDLLGRVSTLAGLAGTLGSADGHGSQARFSSPAGVAVDWMGQVYVADTFNNTIRVISPGGWVRTLAGQAGVAGSRDGFGRQALFNHPMGLSMGRHGELYVADAFNNTIRRVTPSGVVSTVAGVPGLGGSKDGPAHTATFSYPMDVAQGPDGALYVADAFNNTVRRIAHGGVSTLAGVAGTHGHNDGTGATARFVYPSAIAVDAQGMVYVCDMDNQLVRRITPAGVVTTYLGRANVAGTVLGSLPGGLNYPAGIAIRGRHLYVATGNALVSAPLPDAP